jgi:hypothetical protein
VDFLLEGLFGNKNKERVLLFLFVNNKCFATELQKLFKIALTPIQNALERLEAHKVIMSEMMGKTRIYRFNPAYPMISELEILLKKAYTLLPAEEKKMYTTMRQKPLHKRVLHSCLLAFWQRLKMVKRFTRTSYSRTAELKGWNERGQGSVVVHEESSFTLVFHERGSWQQNIEFSNVFRWRLDLRSGLISLEHLRHGPLQPVFLFFLTASSQTLLVSADSHVCEEDIYMAQVPWDEYAIRLNWRVIGPHKNEEMEYSYY